MKRAWIGGALALGLVAGLLIAYGRQRPPAPTPTLNATGTPAQLLGSGVGSQTLPPLRLAAGAYALQARIDAAPDADCASRMDLAQPDGSRLPVLTRDVSAGGTWVGDAMLTIRTTGLYTVEVQSGCVWTLTLRAP